jgi:hypothetical protein
VEGALDGVKALKELGYRLEIVTARSMRHKLLTEQWLAKWIPGQSLSHGHYGHSYMPWLSTHIGLIDKVHYVGEFDHNPSAGVPPAPTY